MNEFDDQNHLQNPELKSASERSEGTASWETQDSQGPEQDAGSVLNSEVVLAEPGLKPQQAQFDDYEDSEELEGDNQQEETEEEKNTPHPSGRRVISFSDYFRD